MQMIDAFSAKHWTEINFLLTNIIVVEQSKHVCIKEENKKGWFQCKQCTIW